MMASQGLSRTLFFRYSDFKSFLVVGAVLSKVIAALIFSLITLYLGYHSLHGQRGYYAWQEQKKILCLLEDREKRLLSKYHALKIKVSLLQDNVDNDLLEQYMWLLFRSVDPDRKVILYP